MPQVYEKDTKDIKNAMKMQVDFESTGIVMVAIHKNDKLNHPVRIPCHGCTPIRGYNYNTVNDTYSFRCHEHLNLGNIGVSYSLVMRGTGGWECRIPVPEDVIKRYLDADQRKNLLAFKQQFKEMGEEIVFEYVQMQSAF